MTNKKNKRTITGLTLLAVLIIVFFGMQSFWEIDLLNKTTTGIEQPQKKLNHDQYSSQKKEITFHSSDYYTGGFSSVTFKLEKEGTSILIDSISVLINENEAGGIYEWTSDTIATGDWYLKNGKIYCRFNRNNGFIEDTFLKDGKGIYEKIKNEFGENITFSEQIDTIYIKGIPCIKSKME